MRTTKNGETDAVKARADDADPSLSLREAGPRFIPAGARSRQMKARAAPAALAVLAATSLVACGPGERDVPAPGAEDILAGSVVYRERIALPADAIVTVRLEDVSIADAPAAVLAEQTIAADGRQVPIPFVRWRDIPRLRPLLVTVPLT